jgi:membrane-associated phospholipid phosphatase
VAAVVALHIALYYLVNFVNAGRPAESLFDFQTGIDGWIPFIPSSSVVYYTGDAYILFFGAYILSKLPAPSFPRAIAAYAGMIVAGAAIQLTLPARAPWPADPAPMQAWMHDAIALRAYACLPSMHVALSVLPAALSLHVLERPLARWTSVVLAGLITLSTLTLKEHYFLDAATGVLLGLCAYAWWRAAARGEGERRSTSKRGGS